MELSQKKIRFGKYMGLGAALAAVFFLFNPNMALVDVLPDCIGYILLSLSLRYWRDLSPHFESAWKKFRILAAVEAVKLLALFWVLGVLTNELERPTMQLLLSFSFSLGELILGIPAWWAFIEGLIIHAQTAGGEYPLAERGARHGHHGENVCVRFRSLTVFFIIAKAFFSNIAEFAVLSTHSYDDTAFAWNDFIGLFRTIAIAFGMIIGLIWLACAIGFFRGLMHDDMLIRSAKDKYTACVLPNRGLFISRQISAILTVIVFAALFTPDIYIDHVNILPDALSAFLLIFAFIKLKPYYKHYAVGLSLSLCYLVLTVWGSIASQEFITGSWVERTWDEPNVFSEFISMYPVRVAEAIMMLAAFCAVLHGVRAIIAEHCGYVPLTMDEAYRTSRLGAIHKEVGVKVTLCLICAVLTAITGGLYELILSLDLFISELWWIINFVVSACFFASALNMMLAVCEEVESRYMLD